LYPVLQALLLLALRLHLDIAVVWILVGKVRENRVKSYAV
jgi:hypothetical protein